MEDDDLFCTRCGKAAKGIQKETQDRESSRGTGRGPAEGKAVRMGYVSAVSGAGKPAVPIPPTMKFMMSMTSMKKRKWDARG